MEKQQDTEEWKKMHLQNLVEAICYNLYWSS